MTQLPAIVVWQPVLTSHQFHTLNALGQAANARIIAFVADPEDDIRAAQGWTPVGDSSSVIDLQVIPKRKWLSFASEKLSSYRNAIHLFGSPFDRPRMMAVLGLAAACRRRIYLISEPYSPISSGYFGDNGKLLNLLKSQLRPLVYGVYGLLLRRRLHGVFAISPLAISQFRTMGIASSIIFPFGYFVPSSEQFSGAPRRIRVSGEDLRVVCVASLIKRKGVTALISAVASLRSRGVPIRVDIYGPGNSSDFEFDDVAVKYGGVIEFGRSQDIMSRYDLFVLPSNFDGWGVVVNEALMAGVPVVCSDRVGAGAVVEKWRCGLVYSLTDRCALERALLAVTQGAAELELMRLAALRAGRMLAPQIAGEYMLGALQYTGRYGNPPACPWYDQPAD